MDNEEINMIELDSQAIHKMPQLRINVTSICNFKCNYCPGPGYGEGYPSSNRNLAPQEWGKIVRTASEKGFKVVKITGGEPLLRSDICEIINEINKEAPTLENFQMVTNGSLLDEKMAYKLSKTKLDSITISLDTTRKDIFQELNGGVDSLDKVIDSIRLLRHYNINTVINMVLTGKNEIDVESIINLCVSVGADLKILDLMNIQNKESYWNNNFCSAASIYERLCKQSKNVKYIEAPGGLGTPLRQYQHESGIKIMVRDGTVRTTYTQECLTCKMYPCHDAKISLRITHDGRLKRCLLRNDNLVDIQIDTGVTKLESALDEVLKEYKTHQIYEHKWKYQ